MLSPEEYERIVSDAARITVTPEMVSQLVIDLGTFWGLKGFSLNEDDCVSFQYEDSFDITLLYFKDQPGVIAVAPLPAGVADNAFLMQCLLASNRNWSLTQGGYFGVLPNSDEFCLFRFISFAGMSVEKLDVILAQFADFADKWREELDIALANKSNDKVDQKNDEPPHLSGVRV